MRPARGRCDSIVRGVVKRRTPFVRLGVLRGKEIEVGQGRVSSVDLSQGNRSRRGRL
jgi:hypothetical protein